MKKTSILFLSFLCITVFSCKKDDAGGCTTCSSTETMPFELCEGRDGSATVNGENTGIDYDIYLSDLIETGVECGS